MDKYVKYIKNSQNLMVKTKQNKNPTNNPIRKWARVMNRHVTEENIWMASKFKKRCSISLGIREMQNKRQ